MSGRMERVCLGTQPTSRKAEMRISPEREIFRSSLKAVFLESAGGKRKRNISVPLNSLQNCLYQSSLCPHLYMELKVGVGQPCRIYLEPPFGRSCKHK